MKGRCTDPNHEWYHKYSVLGYCPEWDSFEAFLADMGERPDNTTLDRIDGTLGYFPGNCRWATKREQAWNRESTLWVTYRGERCCFSEWCRRLGINRATAYWREANGWTPLESLGLRARLKHNIRKKYYDQ